MNKIRILLNGLDNSNDNVRLKCKDILGDYIRVDGVSEFSVDMKPYFEFTLKETVSQVDIDQLLNSLRKIDIRAELISGLSVDEGQPANHANRAFAMATANNPQRKNYSNSEQSSSKDQILVGMTAKNYLASNSRRKKSVPLQKQTVMSDKHLKQVELNVTGMSCSSCANGIEKALKSEIGVRSCVVNLLSQKATIQYDEMVIQAPAVFIEKITQLGYQASFLPQHSAKDKIEFLVQGMTCGSCSSSLENTLSEVAGILSVVVSLSLEKAIIEYDNRIIGPRAIRDKIQEIGYEASLIDANSNMQMEALGRAKEIQEWKRLFIFSLIFMIPEFLFSHILPSFDWFRDTFYFTVCTRGFFFSSLLELFFTIPVQFFIGKRFYVASWNALRHGSATMDVLVVVSTSLAFLYSIFALVYAMTFPELFENEPPMTFFETSTMLITFVLLGRYLENLAKGRTGATLAKLYNLKPKSATLLKLDESGKIVGDEKVPIELLELGDLIRVMPGERIAADGVVIGGISSVDESILTGESLPITKTIGSEVIGGSVNSPSKTANIGALNVRVTRIGNETTLSQIIKLVEDAQTQKPPIQSYADKISSYFVFIVLFLGLLTFVIWFGMLSSSDFDDPNSIISMLSWHSSLSEMSQQMVSLFLALKIAISVVVIACPCALGLATPTAVMVGTGIAAELGILIKNGKALESARSIDAIVLDKTGTLTTGKVSVAAEFDPCTKDEKYTEDLNRLFFAAIGAVESMSEHPFAAAIVEKAIRVLGIETEDSFDSVAFSNTFSDYLLGERDSVSISVADFQSQVGKGIYGKVSLQRKSSSCSFHVSIGSEDWMAQHKCNDSFLSNEKVKKFAGTSFSYGHSIVYAYICSTEESTVKIAPMFRVISLSDTLKPEAPLAVSYLRDTLGIQVFLVTGDHFETARHVALKCGIPERNVYARVSPAGKKSIVQGLQQGKVFEPTSPTGQAFEEMDIMSNPDDSSSENTSSLLTRLHSFFKITNNESYQSISDSKKQIFTVAMCGDGINDSPALAQADIGISLCAGTEIAMEAADIILMNTSKTMKNNMASFAALYDDSRTQLIVDSVESAPSRDLLLLPIAIDLSQTIFQRILNNFTWASLYNLFSVPLAMGALIPFGVMVHPVLAAVMMAVSSISVVLSSLSLRKYKPPQFPQTSA